MNEPKLTIDQLKNYLGTGLKSYQDSRIGPIIREFDHLNMYSFIYNDTSARLMFYRLPNLDKFIPELGFVPIEELIKKHDPDVELRWEFIETYPFNFSFDIVKQLFEWHFWVFDQEYFESGLVIDKLKNNEKILP